MADEPRPAVLQWAPPFLAASNVGLWQWNIPEDRIYGDAVFAGIFGIPEEETRRGIPMGRFNATFHPDDAQQTAVCVAQTLIRGGTFVVEHRIIPAPGVVRWVLGRGHYEKDADGRVVVGRGIVMDVTANHAAGIEVGAAFAGPADIEPVLDRAAELAVDLRRVIEELGTAERGRIKPLIDALLMEIGQQIARAMRVEPGAVRPERVH